MVVLLSIAFVAISQGASDPCTVAIPPDLANAVQSRFPSFSLPAAADNTAQATEYDRQTGGDGCLRVASGDYDGDGREDRAVLLTSNEEGGSGGHRILVVVGFDQPAGWVLSVLRSVDYMTRASAYVTTVPAGEYRRTESLPVPPTEPGEVELLRSDVAAVATGTLESSQVVYVWKGGCWEHVWVSD
jgi:hypothetical protein